MPVYSVEGKLGTGKTKFCVWMAQIALLEGRRVASNVDLRCELLAPFRQRPVYTRVPDKPTSADFDSIGHGNPDSYDEDRNGILILDELGTWLNARSFQDKDRAGVIDWLIHARKHGWDVYLIVQDANMIDKQVREALIEYQCRCMNLSKIRIPLIGKLLPGRLGYLPRMHVVTARTGYGQNAIVAERWMFQGTELHAAYDTRQVFTSTYPHGPHSVLPPWGYRPRELPWLARMLPAAAGFLRAFVMGVIHGQARPKIPPKPKLPWVAELLDLPPDARVAAVAERSRRELEARARIRRLLRTMTVEDVARIVHAARARGIRI